ncbi:protein-associating with the carboxyl-terminal domain of ezrin [Diprion similis]|uniref:protein-associating with the carboxyl-terminal domain of ezrin n=1 Tax=Diprion similis TaxID=362088 RepID=UPI001EF7A251|nr:protein-associating with the carboxyl-terminal domain of ezrin [Diprion similis]
MGNEKSALGGLEIDEKAVEITDFWLHHSASLSEPCQQTLSVFVSEPSLHSGANFGKPSPLEKAAKHLMLHRHPCILKYVASWHKGSKFFLATEEVKPLVQVIGMQTTLQICIGLHNILRALIFLHEKALASHNNVSNSAIYVTPDGFWKLGGLEYLCRFTELTPAYLQKTRNYRYEKAISPEEDGGKSAVLMEPSAIDQFAFGVLAEEVLRQKSDEDVPALAEFKELSKKHLQNADPTLRTKLSSVLVHPFFTHEFITIHSFLMELPLKSDTEKQDFFSNLVVQLKKFPEKIVAEQLGVLLLSRMVLLDSTAQSKLLPFVLTPKVTDDNNESDLLFTLSTFKRYLIPKLLQMFCVRDAQIRLLLLSHFNSFVTAFQLDELKQHVLPELLVGIKDTDDHLVSTTLRALADLIPLLGSATVIGGNRGKLFTDGRPKKAPRLKEAKVRPAATNGVSVPDVLLQTKMAVLELPERPSPDGGEDRNDLNSTSHDEDGNWSDWDAQESANPGANPSELRVAEDDENPLETTTQEATRAHSKDSASVRAETPKYSKKSMISDISELDIKNSKPMHIPKEEIDFFTDMEPVIKKTQVLHIDESAAVASNSMFDVKAVEVALDEGNGDDGWGDDLNDWGAEDAPHTRN